MEIRPVTVDDAASLCAIYNPYVIDTVVSFEETPVAVADMERRIEDIATRYPWLVGEHDGRIVGYAYAAPWNYRTAYRYTVESTIYLDAAVTGRGLGRTLYGALLGELETRGLKRVIGGIALPNPASVALHERLGFVKVGHLEAVGRKLGRWVDVGYWARSL